MVSIFLSTFALLLLISNASSAFAQVPSFSHVFLVVEENHGYSSVVGRPAMPYLNSLANKYGMANNYYAITHPSIGNYFMLTTGEVITNTDGYGGTVNVNNIVRQMVAAGVSWKAYAESLPSVGYLGGDIYPYSKHHNPFAYFSDVRSSLTGQASNIVPFSQFSIDLAAGDLPRYAFIVPNLQNDAHDCPSGMPTCTDTQKLTNADNWLQTNIDPLIKSAAFENSLLVILFDEAASGDKRNSGGHVAAIIISPLLKTPGYRSPTFYQHNSVLSLIATGLGLTNRPGSSRYVSDMAEFFGTATWPCSIAASTPSVSICLPANGTSLVSPVRVLANAFSDNPTISMAVSVDNQPQMQVAGGKVDTSLTLTKGNHIISVQATDNAAVSFSSSVSVTVAAN